MSEQIRNQLAQNLTRIRASIEAACLRSGRSPDQITLVAVTKYAQMEWVRELVELGVVDLGEARPQQLASRARDLPPHIRWHLIGHLQRNKADIVLPVCHQIHSVDSVRLFEHLAKLAATRSLSGSILLEVNVSGEGSKDGFDREELLKVWPKLQAIESLQIAGLMTMAPLESDSEAARPVFRALRELRDQLSAMSNSRWPLRELSMGMSGDFEVAIEEGATSVRIGSSMFERVPATTA